MDVCEMEAAEDRWLLRPEAAAYLRLSVSALAHMACRSEGPRYYRAGKRVRYLKSDLDDWAQSCAHEPLPMRLQAFMQQRRRRQGW